MGRRPARGYCAQVQWFDPAVKPLATMGAGKPTGEARKKAPAGGRHHKEVPNPPESDEMRNVGRTLMSDPVGTRPFAPFEWMLSLRYLRSRRREGFISVIAAFSFIGIMLGVATLIIVMAVMNGFRKELL